MPIACTLPMEQMPERFDGWQRVLGFVTARRGIDGGIRLTLAPGAPIDEIARVVVAEHACCRFLAFAITVDERGPGLEVTAPEDALEVVSALFGPST